MFLSAEDIQELTGYRRSREQRAHLDTLGIPYHVDCMGRPKVLQASLLLPQRPARTANGESPMPNLKALEALESAKA